MAEETFANDLRQRLKAWEADWLKEEDMAIKLREKSIATKIITRDLWTECPRDPQKQQWQWVQ